MSKHTRQQHQQSSAEQRPGRPAKFGERVRQMSVHLRPEQVEWVRKWAMLRSSQEGVSVSHSDVVRIAVDAFISEHQGEIPPNS